MRTYTPTASFIDLLIDAVFAVTVDADIVFASASCERIFGYTPQEMIGKNMFDLMLPEDRELTRNSVTKIMAGDPQLAFENRYVRKDGQVVHIMWSARWSPADQLRIGVARDITERKRAESMQAALYAISEAANAGEGLLALFKHIHQIVSTLLRADNFSVTLYDQETNQLSFPYHVDQHLPASMPPISATDTLFAEIIQSRQALLLTQENIKTYQSKLQTSTGTLPLCWLGVPLKSHNGIIGVLVLKSYQVGVSYNEKDQELLQFVSTQIATAIERRQMQARLQHMAQYDQLTTLPNRALLFSRFKAALSNAQQEQGSMSVLYIDLNKFKQVNDALGHSFGDRLLQKVAERLKQCIGESDTVARVGGDEFVVLLPQVSLPAQAARVAETIHHALSRPIILDGHSLAIHPSIGIAHYPEHGDGAQQLLNHADKAMYSEKRGMNRSTTGSAQTGRPLQQD